MTGTAGNIGACLPRLLLASEFRQASIPNIARMTIRPQAYESANDTIEGEIIDASDCGAAKPVRDRLEICRACRWRALLLTVTAFTLAHSITLTLATLGFVHVPGSPVEAAIAFSILLLACEIIRIHNGQTSLTAQCPWLVAFAFGLLHGLGFAGALADLALPAGDIPLALLFFNVGVESFIAGVIAAVGFTRLLKYPPMVGRTAFLATTYAIGTIASFWFVERVAAF